MAWLNCLLGDDGTGINLEQFQFQKKRGLKPPFLLDKELSSIILFSNYLDLLRIFLLWLVLHIPSRIQELEPFQEKLLEYIYSQK